MKNLINFSILLLAMTLIFSCKKDDAESIIDPADANALTRVLILPDGADLNGGILPTSSNSLAAPQVVSNVSSLFSSNGSTSPIQFGYANTNDDLAGCYLQIAGADSYFQIPYFDNAGTSGSLAVPLGIPGNVSEGEFTVLFCVYNDAGLVSNLVSTTINVLALGSGAFQISLSWDSASDQDLHVEEPGGNTIYFANPTSGSGGQLDRDDTEGFGPENIFWLEGAPDGAYKVSVNDFDETSFQTTVYVTVTTSSKTKRFTATTQNGSTAQIVTIRKSGDNYDF